jgi:4,5-dihydroxyphthalate decarboxylase
MATDLEIQIPWLRYDITVPLIEGRVPIEGVKLVANRAAPNGTVFGQDSPLKTGDFGLVDLNMANWIPAIEAGWELVGLPVFPKRKHLYTYLFCRADAGIATAKDLEGKRVLSSITSSAVGIWWQYLLEKRHGVDLSRITWVSPREQWPIHGSYWKMVPLAGRKSAVEVLLDGDAEAVMVDISDRKLSHALENDPRIKRLFPDYLGEAKRFHEESGTLLPVHIIVMSRKLDRDFPALAGKLVAAFDQAKQLAYGDILDDRSGLGVIDLRERFLAQQSAWGDVFPLGLAANRRALDIFITHCREHGIVKSDLGYDRLLAASTLAT